MINSTIVAMYQDYLKLISNKGLRITNVRFHNPLVLAISRWFVSIMSALECIYGMCP